jgi:hypothetical protein
MSGTEVLIWGFGRKFVRWQGCYRDLKWLGTWKAIARDEVTNKGLLGGRKCISLKQRKLIDRMFWKTCDMERNRIRQIREFFVDRVIRIITRINVQNSKPCARPGYRGHVAKEEKNSSYCATRWKNRRRRQHRHRWHFERMCINTESSMDNILIHANS